MSPGLQRARAPFRLRNALTGLVLGGFAAGVWVYSLRAVKQDEFEDADEEARELARTGAAVGMKSLEDEEKERKAEERRRARKAAKAAEGEGDAAMDVDGQEPESTSTAAGLLADPRFAKVFEDPQFAIDENSTEFAMLNPSAAAQKSRRRTQDSDEESGSDKGSDSEDEDYSDMPSLVDEVPDGRPPIEDSIGPEVDFEDTTDNTEEGGEMVFAIATTGDREYRSAMGPKEVRPQRDFKCLTVYVEVNGMKGLALLDSGSSIDCVSPEFARVAELTTKPLGKPVGLQLGCVGSRSSINFGTRAKVKIGSTLKSMYLDVVNVDHYDLILGVPFLMQFATQLDFRNETIVVGNDRIASLKPGEEQRTAKPYRRGPTGTAAKYQWASKTKTE